MTATEVSRGPNTSTLKERSPQITAVVVGVILIALGLWAFFAPRSFFEELATFEPYNEHFIHDIGSFQIGLGAVLLLGAYLRDALFVVLAGVGLGATMHFLSHVIDRDLGGKPESDLPTMFVTALVLVGASITRGKRPRN